MIKKLADKYALLFSFIITFAVIILFTASMLMFAAAFKVDLTNIKYDINFYIVSILGKIIFFAFVFFILLALKMQSVMRLSTKGLLKGFAIGWFFIVVGVLLFFSGLDFSKLNSIEPGRWPLLIFLAVETLLAGITEEFLCRGILFKVILDKYNNMVKAVFISSAVFGVVHLLNLFYQPVLSTVMQVVYAFSFGTLFAAIYVRCGNIWAVVLLHGFFNFCSGSSSQVLTPPEIIVEGGIADQMPVFVLSAFTVCLAMFLIRKKKTAVRDMELYSQ